MRSRHVLVGLVIWFAVAIIFGETGLTAELKPPGPQIVIAGLTALLVVAFLVVRTFRHWAMTVNLRGIVALHLTRFVGAYFLFLRARGELPDAFAVPAGVGDIAVASSALVLLLWFRPTGMWGGRLYFGWNALGFIDIVGVVVTATLEGISHPGSMDALLRLPLSLLPTFLVPLIVASHVLLAFRLFPSATGTGPARG